MLKGEKVSIEKNSFNSPETKKEIVYIINHKSSDEHRIKNLSEVLNWLTEVKNTITEKDNINLSIVVVEQDEKQTLDNEKLKQQNVEYIFAYNPGYFNRGWGFNVAIRRYKADYYFFADNDIVLPIKDTIDMFKKSFEYEAINPYSSIYDTSEDINKLNDEEKRNIIHSYTKGDKKINEMKYIDNKRENICFGGGIVGLSYASVYNLSGFDERFRGRGYEDYALTAKIKLFTPYTYEYPIEAIHLYHPWEINTSKEENEKLHKEYFNYVPQDYSNLIINTSESFGNINKYTENEEEKFNFSLNKDTFYKRFLDSINYYKKLHSVVTNKHKESNDIEINNYIYYNLCDQHNCYICDTKDICHNKESGCRCNPCKCKEGDKKDCKCAKKCCCD